MRGVRRPGALHRVQRRRSGSKWAGRPRGGQQPKRSTSPPARVGCVRGRVCPHSTGRTAAARPTVSMRTCMRVSPQAHIRCRVTAISQHALWLTHYHDSRAEATFQTRSPSPSHNRHGNPSHNPNSDPSPSPNGTSPNGTSLDPATALCRSLVMLLLKFSRP